MRIIETTRKKMRAMRMRSKSQLYDWKRRGRKRVGIETQKKAIRPREEMKGGKGRTCLGDILHVLMSYIVAELLILRRAHVATNYVTPQITPLHLSHITPQHSTPHTIRRYTIRYTSHDKARHNRLHHTALYCATPFTPRRRLIG